MRRGVAALAIGLLLACRTAGGGEGVRQIDLDGDGRADRFETVERDGRIARVVPAPPPGTEPERSLVLAVDGIPYEVFAELQRDGLFRAFFPPARMVAPFPSVTDVSFTRIFRTGRAAGYEDRFFDRRANRIRGGVRERASGEYKGFAPFHDAFDWEPPRFWGGFVFLVPERIAVAEANRVERLLRERDEPRMVLYMGSTDGLGHELGWTALKEQMRRLDRILSDWMAAGGARRRVVLLSDHGMSDGPTLRFDLEEALGRAGFRLSDRIESERDVVAPAFGLIGSIQLHTACGMEAEVARAVVAEEGADFAVWRETGNVAAVDGVGSADPLDRPAEQYPDLRRRVRQALFEPAVRNPANVIVSLGDGWHYGLELFEPFVTMEGTHGSARRTSTLGFLASNVDPLPASVSADEVHRWLGSSRKPADRPPLPGPCGEDLL